MEISGARGRSRTHLYEEGDVALKDIDPLGGEIVSPRLTVAGVVSGGDRRVADGAHEEGVAVEKEGVAEGLQSVGREARVARVPGGQVVGAALEGVRGAAVNERGEGRGGSCE